MTTFKQEQITSLTTAIASGYPGSVGQSKVRMMLGKLGIDFERYVVQGATFDFTLMSILLDLNSGAGLDGLFVELRTDPRDEVTAAINLCSPRRLRRRRPDSRSCRGHG